MENSIYTVDYFIKKFEAIPENEIGKSDLDNHCALWHCGVRRYDDRTAEARALHKIITGYDVGMLWSAVFFLNDGADERYKQPTPKQRILAALYDIYEKTYGRKYQAEAEPKERIVYVMVDSTVKELSGQLTNN